jgi:hypothetical protein
MIETDDEYEFVFEPGEIVSSHVICQGPPRCNLVGQDAIDAQIDGCVWCQRYLCDRMGRETFIEPGEA